MQYLLPPMLHLVRTPATMLLRRFALCALVLCVCALRVLALYVLVPLVACPCSFVVDLPRLVQTALADIVYDLHPVPARAVMRVPAPHVPMQY